MAHVPGVPIKTFDLIGKDYPLDWKVFRQRDLEGESFPFGSDWAKNSETNFVVVGAGGDTKGRAPPSLFVT